MVLHDDRTGRGYPLPHPDNLLEDDVQRLRDAIDGLDRDATALESGKAAADLSNVPTAVFQAKAAAAGLALPAVSASDAGKSLVVNPEGTGYEVGAPASTIQQTGPLYAPGGSGFSLSGKSVLAAYEQVAGQTFGLDYNMRASYAEQDGVNGTDAVGGAFALHNTAGAVIDANTKLLIHADGVNGSTEILDERGITPFGTHCAYFDGTAYWTVPSSCKVAFGTAQAFTLEGWARVEAFDSNGQVDVLQIYSGSTTYLAFNILQTNECRLIAAGSSTSQTASGAPIGSWFHWAIVRDAGVSKVYVGGVLKGSLSDTYNYPAASISIGRRATNNSCYHIGWQDQIRISKVARYTGNFTPPTTEFAPDADTVHLFQFNDGHGSQFIRDSSKSGHYLFLSNGLTNARSKFGTTALSGSLRITGDSGAASERAIADFLIGSDDFTVDAWVYPTAWGGSEASIFGFSNSATYSASISVMPTGALKIYLSDNNTSYNLQNSTACGSLTLNSWQHVAWVRSGTSVYVFVNGVVTATFTVGVTAALTFSSPMFLFNRSWGSATGGFVGQSSELRVKRGQAVWTSNFTPPTTPYTTDANTILLCHFEGANGDAVTLDSSESSYGASAYGSIGSSVPALSYSGTTALSSTYTRGGHGTSLLLNGTNSYALIQYSTPSAGHPLYFSASDKFCIEGWLYQPTAGTFYLFNLRSASGSTEEMWCNGSGSTTTFGFFDGGTRTVSGPACVAGWNHIACVREGRGYAVYVNGVPGAFANVANTPAAFTGVANLWLGIYNGATGMFAGAIDSFRVTHGKPRYTANFTPGNLTQDDDTALLWVFDGAVGQKWVKELSKNTAMIQSTNARTVKDGRYITPTMTGAGNIGIDTTTAKFGTGSFKSLGNGGNWLTIPHQQEFSPSGDFTVDFWVRSVSTGYTRVILDKTSAAGAASSSYRISVEASTNKINVTYYYNGANTSGGSSVAAISGTTFTHVAIVKTDMFRIYINGVLDTQIGITGTLNNSPTVPLAIGAAYDGNSTFAGWLEELRFSGVGRWTANFTPPTIPYGQQYVTGPFWVATKPGASSLDLTAFSSVAGVAFTGATPPGTTITYLLSTDGYATPLRRWTGSAWVSTAHSMNWNATTKSLATSATAAQLNAAGNSFAELQAGLRTLDVSAVASLNVVAVLASNNPQFSPSLDAITLNMDEYQIMQPGADYTVKRKKANGVQTLEFKRIKAGNANHVIDYVG
ncbi:LamG-like jellyroll fold domain-containing protein [Azospirillum doebereinerae]